MQVLALVCDEAVLLTKAGLGENGAKGNVRNDGPQLQSISLGICSVLFDAESSWPASRVVMFLHIF
jgi:hypothetical protein